MAITYHAGRRLQGLSTDRVQTLTFEDDFSSDGWTDNDSTYIGVSGGSMNWNCKRDGSNDASVYDLTSTSANWVLRFKLTVTNVSSTTGAGNGFFVGLSDSNQTAGQSTSQDFIGMSIYNDNTDTYQTIDADGATVPRLWEGDNSQTTTYNTGSIYYYQIIKTGSSYTVEGFTGSDYSTGSIGSISGTSSASGLRYIKILNETDTIGTSTNPFQGTINALKFYDGVTSITSKPTNVQVGSRFEETDTRKMYHKDYSTCAVLSLTGLKAYYNFEQASGVLTNLATSVGSTDSLGTSADGTNSGATTGVTGIIGNAWSFDGSNDIVTTSLPMNTVGSPYTVTFWYNCHSNGTPFMIGSPSTSNAFLTYHATNYFSVGKYGSELVNTNVGVVDNVWNHVVVTNDGSTMTVYYNGVSIGTNTSLPTPNNDNAYIGGADSIQFFDGEIDDMSYWSRVLTSAEVTTLYNPWKEEGT